MSSMHTRDAPARSLYDLDDTRLSVVAADDAHHLFRRLNADDERASRAVWRVQHAIE